MKAARIHHTGDADALVVEDIEPGSPGPGQVKIEQRFAGLNFIDIYMRTGLYPVAGLPAVLGMEAAGVVVETGAEVALFKVGDRVAYPMLGGAYCEQRVLDADKLVALPDEVDERMAAALMLKGLTAHYLSHRTYALKEGDVALVYAAAGGVGSLLCQWARHLGATVIGCVGNEDKAEQAEANGCRHVILYKRQNIAAAVKDITDGAGVDVVYDAVGKATFEDSLDSLKPCGLMASYGNASGPVPPFSIAQLAAKGSLYVTRPTLATHIATRKALLAGAQDLFTALEQGILTPNIRQSWPLAEVAAAHRALESGQTSGLGVIEI